MTSPATDSTELSPQLAAALSAAQEGAQAVLAVYEEGNLETEAKADDTPLTRADRNAHEVIVARLAETDLPMLSEEGSHADFGERSGWAQFWLIDPLDGTKEFVKRTEEFTVNVALVAEGVPVVGVVVLPALGTVYFGTAADGAYSCTTEQLAAWLAEGSKDIRPLLKLSAPLRAQPAPQGGTCRVVGSRSHMDETTQGFIDALKSDYDDVELVVAGSSAKLCRVAEGSAHIYPRFGPTMEWDTAAGDAVVRAAGGRVLEARADGTVTSQPLRYNKEDLHNPSFVARG